MDEKGETFRHGVNSREQRRRGLNIHRSWRIREDYQFSEFFFTLYLFISSSHLILFLPWTLEIAILCIWLWEADSLFLGEIGRTRCWFFSIISNKFLQYSAFMLVILAGLFYLLLQLRDWIEEIRFNLIKLERGNWIESGIVRTTI